MDKAPSRELHQETPGTIQVHGVLVSVLGVGVLLLGESEMGKSECALDLISRGHQLVADDVVELTASGAGLTGRAPALTREILEVRGLGLINVRELFGEDAFCSEARVELAIEFCHTAEVERIENVVQEFEVAGIVLPKFMLPVRPGRNLAVLVETAVRLYMTGSGHADSMRSFIDKHSAILTQVQ